MNINPKCPNKAEKCITVNICFKLVNGECRISQSVVVLNLCPLKERNSDF